VHCGKLTDRTALGIKILALPIQPAAWQQITQFNPSFVVSMPMNIKQEAILELLDYLRLSASKKLMVIIPSLHCFRVALCAPFDFTVWVHPCSVQILDNNVWPFARPVEYFICEGQCDVFGIVV